MGSAQVGDLPGHPAMRDAEPVAATGMVAGARRQGHARRAWAGEAEVSGVNV